MVFYALRTLSYSDYVAWIALAISLLLYALATRENGELKEEITRMRESIDRLTKELQERE